VLVFFSEKNYDLCIENKKPLNDFYFKFKHF
jgi:hypothetical protein